MKKNIILLVVIVLLIGGYLYFNRNKENNEIKNISVSDDNENVTEFNMTSWMDMVDEKTAAHFSLNEIRVKKGDKVKINITNTAGKHDFTLDEFGIKQETPLNETVTVEFLADKVGTFEYYCSKYNHRSLGQHGNLIVE